MISKLMTSRIGLAAILAGVLWLWHVQDRARAVEAARDGYVQAVDLIAAETELAELRRQLAVAGRANQTLSERVQVARGEALRFTAELEAYERETDLNPDGRVDDGLLRRLRAN